MQSLGVTTPAVSAIPRASLWLALLAAGCGDVRSEDLAVGGAGSEAPTTITNSDSGDAVDDGSGEKLDVGSAGTGAADDGGDAGVTDCTPEDESCECTAVDIMFIVDASGSMEQHRDAMSQVFPLFADTLLDALPDGVNLHVGVTSTDMLSEGSQVTGSCQYATEPVTPDQMSSGVDGEQGRLYQEGGKYFFTIDTDAPAAEREALAQWFDGAVEIAGGASTEYVGEVLGWVGHPANAATNAGFIRDERAVLAIFVLTDEADQTTGDPEVAYQRLLDSKAACGGAQCIVGGGMVHMGPCYDELAMGYIFARLGAPPAVEVLPEGASVEDMNRVLEGTLAEVITKKCETLPPPEG